MKTRLKMHDMPGDIPISDKIAMMERRHMSVSYNRFDTNEEKRAKGYRKQIQMKERAVLKRRLQKELNNA